MASNPPYALASNLDKTRTIRRSLWSGQTVEREEIVWGVWGSRVRLGFSTVGGSHGRGERVWNRMVLSLRGVRSRKQGGGVLIGGMLFEGDTCFG